MARVRRGRRRPGRRARPARRGGALYDGDFFPDVRPVPALRARVLDRAGRLAEALGWARERGLSADDDLSYLREFEHITLAGLLLAQRTTEAVDASASRRPRLLDRLLAGRRGRGPNRQRHRDPRAAGARSRQRWATSRLRWRAGARADPGRAGGLRPGLRRRGPADGRSAASGRAAGGRRETTSVASWPCGQPEPAAAALAAGLVEPLSERELDVLGCSPPTSAARRSPASSWCPSTPCGPTPRTSTPSSA